MSRFPGSGAVIAVIALIIGIGIYLVTIREIAPAPGVQQGTAAK